VSPASIQHAVPSGSEVVDVVAAGVMIMACSMVDDVETAVTYRFEAQSAGMTLLWRGREPLAEAFFMLLSTSLLRRIFAADTLYGIT
jgi:hypothetical protein